MSQSSQHHTHKAIKAKSKDQGWTSCVIPGPCPNQEAHGGIIRHDVCACGATKKTEINGRYVNHGPWGFQ